MMSATLEPTLVGFLLAYTPLVAIQLMAIVAFLGLYIGWPA